MIDHPCSNHHSIQRSWLNPWKRAGTRRNPCIFTIIDKLTDAMQILVVF